MTSPAPRKKLPVATRVELRRDVAGAPRLLAPAAAAPRRSLPTASAMQALLAGALVAATLAGGAMVGACSSTSERDSMQIGADRDPAGRPPHDKTSVGTPPGVGTALDPVAPRSAGEPPPVMPTSLATVAKPKIAPTSTAHVTGGVVAPVVPSPHPPTVKGGPMRVSPTNHGSAAGVEVY